MNIKLLKYIISCIFKDNYWEDGIDLGKNDPGMH